MVQAKQQGEYPPDWADISARVRQEAGNKCIRCGNSNDASRGYTLTVHHWDGNRSNNAWWNLLPLCQRCHLQIQHKVHPDQLWLLPHSEWFKSYVAGWYAHNFGLQVDRQFCERFKDSLILLGQERISPAQFVPIVRTALYNDVDLLLARVRARLFANEDAKL